MKLSNCILSTYSQTVGGYAKCEWQGKTELHHRLAYIWHHKLAIEDIKGKVIRHSCDMPNCINPEHLLLGTTQDNVADKIAKGRQRGAPKRLTEIQLVEIRASALSYAELATRYAVGYLTILRVCNFQGGYKREIE